ncbi:MAG: DUF1573 domain-containing protein [Bergeyella sp.]
MKKLVLGFSLSITALGLQSCKKETTPAVQEVTAKTSAETVQNDSVQTPSQPLTNLALSEDSYSFGDVKKGQSVEHVYEVTNTGTNPLIISSVKPGCGCTAPDYTKDPIMPGQKGKITLKFDSSNFDGMVQKQAEVFANVEKSPIVIGFTANIVQ